jgi:hypothetical protein
MAKRNVKKIKLADLLGEEGKPNADFYKGDKEKRKRHVQNRVPRGRLVTVRGGEYKRSLSGDAAKDIKLHELAREFISNGFNQAKAYAAVYGITIRKASHPASRIFNSIWMKAIIHDMVRGVDGEMAEPEKEYLLEKLMKQIESNVLDYIDDEGAFLNVQELKALPKFCQQIIKKLEVSTWHVPVMEVLHEGDDPVEVAQIRHQKVHLELYDKHKALELLAKAMRWISGDTGDTNIFLGAAEMIAANKRAELIRREDIEGESTRVTPD